jgi:WD40 repeat protein
MKILLILLTTFSFFFAQELKPTHIYKANGAVTDIIYTNGLLYASTDASSVDIFDTKTNKMTNSIKVPKIKDFMGDIINAKVYSIDVYKNNILITSQAEKGFREIYIFDGSKLNLIIGIDKGMFISKAKFVNENQILFSLLSNQMFLYDIKTKKNIWEIQVSQSKFSNFALNEDKSKVVVADESGDLKLLHTKNGKLIKVLAGQNLDNVFQVDFKSGLILTAGQDRRAVVYKENSGNAYYKQSGFLIYSVGLSPSGKLAAFASDENNNVTVFNTITKTNLYKLGHNAMNLTNILFINDNEVYVSSDDKNINYYKLK